MAWRIFYYFITFQIMIGGFLTQSGGSSNVQIMHEIKFPLMFIKGDILCLKGLIIQIFEYIISHNVGNI